MGELLGGFGLVAGEVGVDELDDELGGVGV